MTGIVLGWIWGTAPLKQKVRVLETMKSLYSEKSMERVLRTENYFRLEQEKVQKLQEELKWAKAKVKAQELDLDRMNQKLMKNLASGMDLPQQNMSYWRIEGPKLKQKVLDLEMELENLRSKTLWKE
jgi:hypothetical protein